MTVLRWRAAWTTWTDDLTVERKHTREDLFHFCLRGAADAVAEGDPQVAVAGHWGKVMLMNACSAEARGIWEATPHARIISRMEVLRPGLSVLRSGTSVDAFNSV